ncbi:MAG: sulfatase-like hydrolase/transferase [bacterium]|nr:sulfatase-like hydrolase/transferase [bacterium]
MRVRSNHAGVPFGLMCGFTWAVLALLTSTAADERPNFIVIMVDDMGYEGISCFGNPYFETQQIDRLAAEGMRLTDFHSSGTVCSPTRTGLLTGRYQQRAGIEAVIHPEADHPEHRKGLQLKETTFAELLAEAGYATGLIGKWHQGYPQNSDDYHPQNHGFHEFVGYHSGNIDFVSHIGDHNRHDWWYGRQETREVGYSTDLINEASLDFVNRHANQDHPFCLYIAHEAIHNPVQIRGDAVRRTADNWNRWKWQEVSQQERIDKYRGMTLPVDEGIGRLREALFELGIEKNTLLIFFSDNGPSADFPSGSPELRGGKGSVYEGGHKVPAIAWWPEHIQAGGECDQPLISLDVMPTLLSLAGLDPQVLDPQATPKPLDGVDLSPVLLRGESLAPRPLYWASLSNSGARSEALREGPWKLVVTHPRARPGSFDNEHVELYHLADDPSEKVDLASVQAERAARMLAQLKDWYAQMQNESTQQLGGWESTAGETPSLSEPAELPDKDPLVASITKTVLRRNRDGKSTTWFHPRACLIPKDQDANVLMTLQEISGSDYFGPVHWTISQDQGATWSKFEQVEALGRVPVPGHPGLEAGVCDVTPQYHPQTDSVLALGHVVFYRGPKFASQDQLARYPVYAVRHADGSWGERKILEWDDPRGSFIYSNNCGQRVVAPNGDIMMSFTFGSQSEARSVAGVRCSFDGDELRVLEVGPPLTNPVGRGLLEPSLTVFEDHYFLTLRAEDGHGYVAVSDDGLNYRQKAWAWDDGQMLKMSSTQQHWLTHSDSLYLVYTREDTANANVIRWRSPLCMARVDTQSLCLVRATEQVVLPLVGDGVRHSDGVALMGNFDVTNISSNESWVTVGEWLPRRSARGDLLLARIRWTKPNRRVMSVGRGVEFSGSTR